MDELSPTHFITIPTNAGLEALRTAVTKQTEYNEALRAPKEKEAVTETAKEETANQGDVDADNHETQKIDLASNSHIDVIV